MSFACRNCGTVSDDAYTLCSAAPGAPEAPFCGIPEEWICESSSTIMKYSCGTCGSFSAHPENLCKPEKADVVKQT